MYVRRSVVNQRWTHRPSGEAPKAADGHSNPVLYHPGRKRRVGPFAGLGLRP